MSIATAVYEEGWLRIKLLEATTSQELPAAIFPVIVSVLHRKERFRLFVDATSVVSPPWGLLARLAAFIRMNRPAFAAYLIGSALITPSKVVKKLLGMLFKLQKPVAPNIVCDTVREGADFLKSLS